MLRKRHYLQQQLESHFWPRKRWNLDFSISIKVIGNWILLQTTSIPNQLEFWAANYGQNTKQVQKITQIQHYLQFSLKISNGNQHQICPSLSNRLILSLCFRRNIFENKLDKKQIHPMKKIQKCSKKGYYFHQQFETHFWPEKRWNLVFSISEKVVDNEFHFKKHQSWINWNFGQKVRVKIRNRCSIIFNFLSNSNGNQHQIRSSSFKQVISSLSFRTKIIS